MSHSIISPHLNQTKQADLAAILKACSFHVAFMYFLKRHYTYTCDQCHESIMHFICVCTAKGEGQVCESIILFTFHRHAPLDFRTLVFPRGNNRMDWAIYYRKQFNLSRQAVEQKISVLEIVQRRCD